MNVDRPTPTDREGVDLGFTHVALVVADLDESIAFYRRFGGLDVVHRRADPEDGNDVAWLSDQRRPFVIVLIRGDITHRLGGWCHLGVAVDSRSAVDDALADAAADGIATYGPFDHKPPVGYFGIICDPDGHQLELSHGQQVAFAVLNPPAEA